MTWFRGTHSSNDSKSSVRFKSPISPNGAQQHSWYTLNGLANFLASGPTDQGESEIALSDFSALDIHPVQGHTSTRVVGRSKKEDADYSAEKKVLKSSSSNIVAANIELKHQTIMVASEHYFRLVLESYEHLRATHYRASQKFSLAEWLHIHALLLYGKIQSVQRSSNLGNVDQHNRIDLSSDVLVFDPIATALNAIGTVKDLETGVLYIPDAHFPKVSKDTIESALELQQILNGTLYDWQRSWMRVAEARQSRIYRDTEFAHARSSSQLITAIQRVTEKLGRAKQENRTVSFVPDISEDDNSEQEKDSDFSYDSAYSGDEFGASSLPEEEQLHVLFEEARNAKDYTIRPPCDRLYCDVHPHLIPIYLERKMKEQEAASKRKPQPYYQMPSAKGGLISNLAIDTKDSQLESLALKLSKGVGGTVDEGGDKVKVVDRNQEPIQNIQTDYMTPEEEPKRTSDLRGLEASPCSIPGLALRKTSQLRISDSKPYQSLPSSSSLLATTYNETLVPSSTSSVRLRGAHVKIGGSSKLNEFVQYDSQLWQDYARFVDALTEPNLASFSPLKTSEEGSYAWMIPVSVQNNGDSRTLHLQLPRKSIPLEDQALALILQTSYASQDLLQSWHVSMIAQIPLKDLMTSYVKSAIKARF